MKSTAAPRPEPKKSPAGTYLMTRDQHLAMAQALRKHTPDSRAAQLHEAAAKMREPKAQKLQ
jgi:hypothetical protein